jgi:hypothetical protein
MSVLMMSSESGASVSALYSDFSFCIFHNFVVNKNSFLGFKIFSQHQHIFSCYESFPYPYTSRKLMIMKPSKNQQYLLFYFAILYYQQSSAGYTRGMTSRHIHRRDDGKKILKKECDGMLKSSG